MIFNKVVSRFNEEDIQDIIGKESLSLLQNFNEDLVHISHVKDSILKIYSPYELLTNPNSREIIIDLLKQDEIEELAMTFGLQSEGNKYELVKNSRLNSQKKFNLLLNFFELPEEDEDDSEEVLDKVETLPKYPLFEHQICAIKDLKLLLFDTSRRALLHMPTGSGKTRTSMNLICEHLRNSNSVVIWFANTEELCEQALMEFTKAWSFIGNRKINTYRFWGSSSVELESISEGFIVAGLSKMYSQLKLDHNPIVKLSAKTSLIIMDEAHMAIAPTYKQILELLYNGNADSSLLGLSATPGRTWNNPAEDRELSDFFSNKKVTLNIKGYKNPVDYLVEQGYLAKINNVPIFNESGFDIHQSDIQFLKDNLRLPDAMLRRLSNDRMRNLLIIKKIQELIKRHKRIILFALNVQHSHLLAVVLQGLGINAFSITSDTESIVRKETINLFKSDSDDHLVLCNYGILTTGFDAPQTSCAVITRPTDSLVLYSQMVGRAIRGPKAGGNFEAEIITVIDTFLPGFRDVSEAFFNWEDVWD